MLTEKIIRLPIVVEMTGLSKSAIRRREQAGQFPLRRHLGSRAVGWLQGEIMGWIQSAPLKKSAHNGLNK